MLKASVDHRFCQLKLAFATQSNAYMLRTLSLAHCSQIRSRNLKFLVLFV